MAYNNYYPQFYQPLYQQPVIQRPAEQTGSVQQIQNGGFVNVRSEAEAKNYPVANGLSVTFKDENAPFIYTKTMGFSQLDSPIFEKYRLVKEEPTVENAETTDKPIEDDIKSEIDAIKADTSKIWAEINALKEEMAV